MSFAINSLSYSTEAEKDIESRSVKYAYELRDKAIKYARWQLASLSTVLVLSLWTLRDSFSCTGSFEECDNIRSNLTCKA